MTNQDEQSKQPKRPHPSDALRERIDSKNLNVLTKEELQEKRKKKGNLPQVWIDQDSQEIIVDGEYPRGRLSFSEMSCPEFINQRFA